MKLAFFRHRFFPQAIVSPRTKRHLTCWYARFWILINVTLADCIVFRIVYVCVTIYLLFSIKHYRRTFYFGFFFFCRIVWKLIKIEILYIYLAHAA